MVCWSYIGGKRACGVDLVEGCKAASSFRLSIVVKVRTNGL